jgi:putative phosphoribosyl transferase
MQLKRPKLRKEVLFRNRKDAGKKLAARIANFDLQRPLVLALPRGGIPVAIEIAKVLVTLLDLLLVRKLSTSWQPEMAVGAIFGGTNPYTVVNEDIARTMGITEADVTRIAKIQFEELEHRRHLWLGGRQRISIVAATRLS